MYDYAPTPRGIHAAVEEALKQERELVRPGEAELAQVQERRKIPENEQQLHSLLMAEGDLAAGELDIPVEWLEKLAEEGRAVYLEQGLWIAAEQQEEYRTALEQQGEFLSVSGQAGTSPAMPECAEAHIVRRMLRYRGGASASNIAHRYGWEVEKAHRVLEELCRNGEAVKQEETKHKMDTQLTANLQVGNLSAGNSQSDKTVYYHAQLYKRARVQTLINRREEISTCPPENYISLLLSRIQRQASAEECLKAAIDSLAGLVVPAAAWEEWILPARVRNYRENYLDSLLAGGEYFWHMEEGGKLRFDSTQDIDWDKEPEIPWETLSEPERLLAEALSRRGASFMQALKGVLPEHSSPKSVYDVLQSLLEKGVVCADSFIPVRQWLSKEKLRKASARQRVNARVKALQAGRFDLVRPLRILTVQEQMDRCFDRYLILSRETAAACDLSWQEALDLLRVQEYTGQVRRGYFVRGLSGAQFIRREDFESVTHSLLHPVSVSVTMNADTVGEKISLSGICPRGEVIWLNAADPGQPWGKLFPHEEGRTFINVPGTAVALVGGIPAAIFERQGKTFRVFEREGLEEILLRFAEEFKRGRIFADRKRIVVKEYPAEAAEIFSKSGFIKEMQDYSLYR